LFAEPLISILEGLRQAQSERRFFESIEVFLIRRSKKEPLNIYHYQLHTMTQKDTQTPDLTDELIVDEAGSQTPVPELDLQAQLDAALAQNITLQDLALRAKAEAENVRRRAAEDISKAHKYALENFAESLLPVRDTLELGLANTTQTEAALREGVEATLRLLVSAFEKHKLLAIEPAPGTKFDPSFHNGVSMMPSEHPAQTVAVVMQKGYQIGDRVMRPALVAVSSGA
jgi:molecular chaperone GrpE